MMLDSERGIAPVLAIFLIFVVVSSNMVILYLNYSNQEEISTIQRLTAEDITKATNESIKSEMNKALNTSIAAAMYDVGSKGGTEENIEKFIINYMNQKIQQGWNYPNIEVNIPLINENSIDFTWQPNGSLIVKAYLKSKVRHVKGPIAYGISLKTSVLSRFQRLKYIANQISEKAEDVKVDKLNYLENSLNENYRCEGIKIELAIENSNLEIKVKDIYGAKRVIIQR